jgi:hypothetical protein
MQKGKAAGKRLLFSFSSGKSSQKKANFLVAVFWASGYNMEKQKR